ncbi:hypothetical protein Bca4012_085888 [Brassica carinata]
MAASDEVNLIDSKVCCSRRTSTPAWSLFCGRGEALLVSREGSALGLSRSFSFLDLLGLSSVADELGLSLFDLVTCCWCRMRVNRLRERSRSSFGRRCGLPPLPASHVCSMVLTLSGSWRLCAAEMATSHLELAWLHREVIIKRSSMALVDFSLQSLHVRCSPLGSRSGSFAKAAAFAWIISCFDCSCPLCDTELGLSSLVSSLRF